MFLIVVVPRFRHAVFRIDKLFFSRADSKISVIVVIALSGLVSGCRKSPSTVEGRRAVFVKEGEVVPFDGVLCGKAKFFRLVKQARENVEDVIED